MQSWQPTKTVNGILVQLPLPKQIDEHAVIDAIPPEKDVDGFSPVNVGRMQTGQPCFLPCTPAGCIRMVESTGTKIDGKKMRGHRPFQHCGQARSPVAAG